MKTVLAAAFSLLLVCAVSRAAPLEDAKAAYDASDYAKALALYQPLAEKGDAEAQFQVGVLYEQGAGVAKDAITARRWYDKAAQQGHPGAMMWIGHTYAEGDGVSQDYAEAMDWYKKAAAKKYSAAWTAIGGLYAEGQGVKKDFKESVKWYRKAADAGEPTGMHDLSVAYRDGAGVSKDAKEALKWSLKAAALGFVPSMINSGWAYLNGSGTKKDYKQAFAWYKKAADLGDAEGQNSLGRMYMDGHGVPLDYGEALRLFHLAGDQGNVDAMENIGWCYDHGYGVERDGKKTVEWYQKAADTGDAYAQHYLGTLYYNGTGVAQDTNEGCRFFRLAAAQGYADSIALLPRCPQEGEQAASPPTVVAPAAPAAAPATGVDAPGFHLKPRPSDFALIVGIENYRRAPRADFAENDASAVEANLLALGLPQRNIIHISGDDATRSRIQAYLDEWLPKNVKADSTVFFYYSGHGAPDAQSGEAYILPSDGDPSFLKTTAYPLKDVYAALGRLPAKQVVVALDSCFSGAGGRSVIAKGARPLVTNIAQTDTGKLVVFAAAQGEQITGSNPDDAHGLFTHYFLQGLAGGAKDRSGKVTVRGLFDYLKPLVEDGARRDNREQSPTLRGPKDVVLAKF